MTQIEQYDDAALRDILSEAKVVALVGYSDDPSRPSYQIGQFLKRVGYHVYPVNPTIEQIDGDRVYATLADVPEKIDVVNVFRRSEYLAGVVDEAITVGAPVVWAQFGVSDPGAARKGEDAGVRVIMNNCIKISYLHLMD